MKVELLRVDGDELEIVNAARVSYAKRTEVMRERDLGLIRYLARNNEWSPFAHPRLSFRIAASIAVADQLHKHVVAITVIQDPIAYNRTSRRYVTDAPTFDLPDVWRSAPGEGQSKQGSGEPLDKSSQKIIGVGARALADECKNYYDYLLQSGVAPEQARLVLPMCTVTEWISSGSLMAWIRVCKERLPANAQQETRDIAVEIHRHLAEHFPESVKAWGLDA